MSDTPISPAGRLAGKIAVITGGATGIGRATALLFAAQGAKVSIFDIQQDEGEKTAQMIRDTGGEAAFFKVDVTKSDEIDKGFDAAIDRFGPYNVLFNHAGTIIVKPLHETTEAEYDSLMDINVKSAFLVCRRAVREMSENGGGSIVITSSIAAELGYALEAVYCMSKGAVLQLSRAISTEYRDQGIRCNAVCPGFVETAHGLKEIAALDAAGQTWEASGMAETQGRICTPEEVANAVLFLCSGEASFVNGTATYVDNGWYAKG
ncbi:SDR family NAD(P)-dependent oxidoreductase [Candidatus Halocynthiibacter alkanivorans]|uniref:SDR family NAD(P)-dependent oxidoreductase n=1 Tax=Candidatus Halocynthiibacter alkanivorans TaxID=2267619 RepID=UPI00190F9A87|nr:SDR family NAD(P)-dependent oxidoreductase [Candidatus Halocynthiibacter alkanivorans]